jgi:hypothetical protein
VRPAREAAKEKAMTVRPFEVAWKNEDVADVRRKVKEVHLPPAR